MTTPIRDCVMILGAQQPGVLGKPASSVVDELNGGSGFVSDAVQAVMPDGTSIWVRVNDDDEGPRDTGFGDRLSRQLADLPQTLETITHSVRSGLRRAAPDEVTLEFGIEIAVRSGQLVSVVTEAGGSATLRVTATWRKGEPEVGLATEAPDEAPDGDLP
ncbi:CU044_2847 family protein [Streptomyces sp. NPDC091259]|uniref:CU044_2847 family protein n=1 Tax=Streptomyces sp. NPDC091259 TaxID=3365976 RepID=UPI00380C1C65